VQKAYFDSPIGVLEICGDESGVCELNFVREFICAEVTDANLKLCLSELESYFKGELKTFKTRLNIGGTAFQRCIYENLQKIWALRSAISTMDDVEALKFLYAKMLKTKDNTELLSIMNG